ncbi:MAG: peptide chain release factor N(5)-glutamine methyltransferase [Puniceicoccales bacterium]|jgi:release factor glutamine methyltransferase|nr:peptide chain release factor N(5)-glutamine methyltransferase [Puniceicoccales bacterium]
MPSVLELLRSSEYFLKSKGVPAPRLDAELLLAHVLGGSRSALHLNRDAEVGSAALANFWDAMHRRGNREPLQYIIGTVEFYGLELAVNESVLIPRHETEMLVDLIISKVQSKSIGAILDLGTGSGAIALALAKRFPTAEVLAIDISEKALAVASENAVKNSIGNALFLRSDWFGSVHGNFDIIAANPPYLSEEEYGISQDEVRCFEPKFALVAKNRGLGEIFKIITAAGKFLKGDGLLAIETGSSKLRSIANFAKRYWQGCEVARDLSGYDRFVFLRNAIPA